MGRAQRFTWPWLKPLATNTGVRALLTEKFETASPHLKTQLLWRLLNDPDLPHATHRNLFDFVTSEWDTFTAEVARALLERFFRSER